jgi:hypothetical protein
MRKETTYAVQIPERGLYTFINADKTAVEVEKTARELFNVETLGEVDVIPMADGLLDSFIKTLHIETLETRNSDSMDFPEVAVWNLKHVLIQAYCAGYTAAKVGGAR